MEEKKNVAQTAPKKLSYEELQKVAGDLSMQYQKLQAEYQRAVEALNRRDFDYTSFFLSMLFKVMEHPEMYKDEFVKWCSENIEGALTAFAQSAQKSAAEDKKQNEAE